MTCICVQMAVGYVRVQVRSCVSARVCVRGEPLPLRVSAYIGVYVRACLRPCVRE